MTNEELLAELDEILRTMPEKKVFAPDSEDNLSWIGRASAILHQWDPITYAFSQAHISNLQSHAIQEFNYAYDNTLVLINRARHDLRMKIPGSTNVSMSETMVFEYFDVVRKVIESSKKDVLFVDPYLDADFVSRYLPHITTGVTIRLLAREKLITLVPAAKMFVQQHQTKLEIRSAPNFHDRYVFIDGIECYQSGASFKDGAKKSPTTITQIRDAFPAVFKTYEGIWKTGRKIV